MAYIFQGQSKVAQCVREWDRQLRTGEWVDTDVFATIFDYAAISGTELLAYEKAILIFSQISWTHATVQPLHFKNRDSTTNLSYLP